MPWNSGLKKLHKLLTDLYRTEDQARMAVAFAQLDTRDLSFRGGPQTVWFNILEEAERLGMVDALVAQACRDAPNRCDELGQAYDEYLEQLSTDSSQQTSTTPPPAPILGKIIEKQVPKSVSEPKSISGWLQWCLGVFNKFLGRTDAALKHYVRALELAERAGDVRLQGKTLSEMGTVYQAQGDYPGARAAFERALSIFEELLSPDHPDIKTVRGDLQSLIKITDEN
jgi:tetratricopeptide (TPR) repeat protein